jgi:hypothetical protein
MATFLILTNRRLLWAIVPLLIASSCGLRKSDTKSNKGILGKWYSIDNPKTFIEIDGDNYREFIGEIDSELNGTIHWTDSLSFELRLTKVEGVVSQGKSLRPGMTFHFKILNLSSDTLQMNANNMLLTFSRHQ